MGRIIDVAFGVSAAVLLGRVVERELIAAPHAHGRRFRNLVPTEHGSFWKWQLTRERGFWREWVDDVPGEAPPARVGGGRVRVTFVNHATMLVQFDGINILTDPIWSMRCSPFAGLGPKRHRPPGIRFRDLPPIDVVLVSHNHYDHLDLPTLHALRKRHRPRFVLPLGNDLLLRRHGIRNVTALSWWQSTALANGIDVTLVPAQHFCARGLSDRDASLWGGFVIRAPSGNVYFAGDTGWGPHFAMIAERFAPLRLAMLPIGAYLPRWFMQPVHVSPEEAVEAHKILGAQTSVAMHYGTFNLGDDGELQPLDDLRAALEANSVTNFLTLAHGEGRDV
jgi:L-ascorbate metabolism protein UlaG (beta-lactamase superfamily)